MTLFSIVHDVMTWEHFLSYWPLCEVEGEPLVTDGSPSQGASNMCFEVFFEKFLQFCLWYDACITCYDCDYDLDHDHDILKFRHSIGHT